MQCIEISGHGQQMLREIYNTAVLAEVEAPLPINSPSSLPTLGKTKTEQTQSRRAKENNKSKMEKKINENLKIEKKINETKNSFFEKINKVKKLAMVTDDTFSSISNKKKTATDSGDHKRTLGGGWGDGLWVKSLLRRKEGIRSHPQHPHRKLRVAVCACDPSPAEAATSRVCKLKRVCTRKSYKRWCLRVPHL